MAEYHLVADKERGNKQFCYNEKIPVYNGEVWKFGFSVSIALEGYNFFEDADVDCKDEQTRVEVAC